MLPSTQTYLFLVFQKRQKISKGLNSISLELQHQLQKMISRKYKLNSMYTWKKGADFSETSESNLFLGRSNAKSHSFFLWIVMFNLTILWVRDKSISFFRTQKSC